MGASAKFGKEKVLSVHDVIKRQRTGSIPVIFISFLYLQILPAAGDDLSKRNIQCKAHRNISMVLIATAN